MLHPWLIWLEKLAIKRMSGRAKVIGTLLGVAGAMVLTFYKGIVINLWPTSIHLLDTHPIHAATSQPHEAKRLLGALISLAKITHKYPCYYSSTALMCFAGAMQSVVFALFVDHDWKLGWNIRLLTVAYSGVIGSGLMVTFQAWCVQIKGPLYVSVFSPVQLILVALAGSLMLDEKLHLGSVLGAMFIITGLYAVLWGKAEEIKILHKVVPSLGIDDQQADEMKESDTIKDAGEKVENDRSRVAIEPASLHIEIAVV